MADLFDTEQTVERMIADGAEILRQATEYVEKTLGKKIIGYVAAFSGGDDSIVTTHFANEALPDCCTFNADTMVGFKQTRCHIKDCIERMKWTGEIEQATAEGPPKPKTITDNNRELLENWIEGETAYEEFVLNHGFGGPPLHPRMYQRLKERPLLRLRRRLAGGTRGGRLIVISGIRQDESSIRAGYKRAWQDVPQQGITWVNPFYYHSKADFAAYSEEFGLPRNPVKARCGISGECCCGTFGDKAERESYREIDPEFSQYLDDLEARVRQRFPWGWGEGPPKWWMEQKRGQKLMWPMLPDDELPTFQPMCVGCNNGRR